MSLRVFISYRREDTAGHAGRLHDSLASRLASAEVFMDVGDIEPGEDFTTAIIDAVATCDVMLALIGTRWVSAATSGGQRRLDDPDDYVVAEIAAALERQVRVIPVLVEGARMPRAPELPERIRSFERRNALALDTMSWATDLEALLAALRNLAAEKSGVKHDPESRERTEGNTATSDHEHTGSRLPPRWTRRNMLMTAAVAIVAMVIVLAALAGGGSGGDGPSQPVRVPPESAPGGDRSSEPLRVTPESAPGGSTVEVSGGPCPAVPEGKLPGGIYFGLHDPRAKTEAEENPAKGFAAPRPGEPWTGRLDVPDGTSPGQYIVYAGCFAVDPEHPDRLPDQFFPFPAAPFEVVLS